MSDTYLSLFYHCVWSTKNRFPALVEPNGEKMFALIARVMQQQGAKVIAIGGYEDHVHVLFSVRLTVSIVQMIRQAKSISSRELRQSNKNLQYFEWQKGYSIFTVSSFIVPKTTAYIKNQVEHHKNYSSKFESKLLYDRHLEIF